VRARRCTAKEYSLLISREAPTSPLPPSCRPWKPTTAATSWPRWTCWPPARRARSIADGVGSGAAAPSRWPDLLAQKLAPSSVAVLNAGIAGNRLLKDAAQPFVGTGMLKRLQRDVLERPGVRWMVLHAGANDINAAGMLAAPEQQASAQDIIAGMQAVIERAHAAGVKVCGATLLPFGGVGKPFVPSAEGEAKRQAVNAWIREAGQFDAVADFDMQLRDPAQPGRLLPAYDSGDHLHPNDAGYQAMANVMPALQL
jgi:lysophospholipase L1-like esterase